MPKFFIARMLVRDLGVPKEVSVPPGRLREVILQIDRMYPGFKDSLFYETWETRPFVNIFVNGINVRGNGKALESWLEGKDVVHIFPSVAGG